VTLQARNALIETSTDLRGSVRRKLLLEVETTNAASHSNAAVVHNLSEGGLLLETNLGLSVGDIIEVALPRTGTRPAEAVWVDDHLVGCRFTEQITPGAVSAALLRGSIYNAEPTRPDTTVNVSQMAGTASEEASANLSMRQKVSIIAGSSALLWAVMIAATVRLM